MKSLSDLVAELGNVLQALEGAGIEYALCGGLAMAVHGYPRATIDIDVLVLVEDEARARAVVAPLGYVLPSEPMSFGDGAVEIRRVSKIDEKGELLSVDLLLVTPTVRPAWESRQLMAWDFGTISVVSREGMILLKSLRGSGLDRDDIEHLRGEE
jgi:hypothetical protein